ncbi:fatty acid desaturase DES3-like isoform X2 [Gigantopelta aegis]|nr:fatty acid desaturase DES3-like isoform X2 [Gigantopelta aegis]
MSGAVAMGTESNTVEYVKDKVAATPDANTNTNANTATKSADETNFPSIIEIKKTIPPHCFEPCVATSFYYAAKDLFMVALLYAASEAMWQVLPAYVALALTPLYWLLQGTYLWAIFVVGHDCGHDSFSKSVPLNDVVGTVLHTLVFAPYYCWKLSHRHHHKNTGNIDRDEVFYPIRSDDGSKGMQALPGFGLGVAWFIYLMTGYHDRPVCHFNPLDALFKRHVAGCAVSVASIAVWCLVLWRYVSAFGAASFAYHYAVPLFVSTTYLVIVTFLHHNEVEIPWYADSEWRNVKGQISSVDRDYGWCHELTHNIGTHQIHHLFPKIPHYHLEEATRHFRKTFPDLVHICNEPIIPAFVRMFKTFVQQHVIGKDVVIHIYKK